jgi:ATP-dependent Clp protease ATP-binding subunit ClpA
VGAPSACNVRTEGSLAGELLWRGARRGGRKLPDAAIDLMDEAAALRRMRGRAAEHDYYDTAEALSEQQGLTGVSTGLADASEWQKSALQRADGVALTARRPIGFAGRRPAQQHPVPVGPGRWRKTCPHCGYAVPNAPSATLLCPDCLTLFLNGSQEQLLLGTTVVPAHKRPGYGAPAQVLRTGSEHTHIAAAGPAAAASSVHPHARASASVPAHAQPQAPSQDSPMASESLSGSPTAARTPDGVVSSGQGVRCMRVSRQDVFEVVSAEAGVPLGQLTADAEWFRRVHGAISEAVWGQEAAVRCAATRCA